MSVVKITFDGSSVSSKEDADINYFLSGCQAAGIIKGLGNNCSVTYGNNYIYFASGYVEIYGRRIYIQEQTSIYITLDSSKYGYVCVTVNLDDNSVVLEKIENGNAYPSLIQENLHSGGMKYQFPLCRYTKTTSSLTVDSSYTPRYIETVDTKISTSVNNLRVSLNNKFEAKYQGYYSSKSGNTYLFNNITNECSDGIGAMYLKGDGVYCVFSCANINGSGGIVYYHNSVGTYKSLSMQLTGSCLYVEPSDKSVVPMYVRITR